jgi:hypothetical protein
MSEDDNPCRGLGDRLRLLLLLLLTPAVCICSQCAYYCDGTCMRQDSERHADPCAQV